MADRNSHPGIIEGDLLKETWTGSLSNLDPSAFVFLFLAIVLCRFAAIAVYRLYFHPLAKFPGPSLFAVSFIPFLYHSYITGKYHRKILEYHQRYGSVVRLGPNHLAFDGHAAFPQIYNHRSGRKEWLKVPDWLFQMQESTIIGADTKDHRRMRRQIGPAFSDNALKEQENIILKYTDALMDRISTHALRGHSVDVSPLFNFFAFDVISDLAFSNPMGSLEKGEFHPWVRAIMHGGPSTGVYRFCKGMDSGFPFYFFIRLFGLGSPITASNEDGGLAVKMATQRLSAGCYRPDGTLDFVGHMEKVPNQGKNYMTPLEIQLNASTLIVAGSETTASALTGCIFYLDRYPLTKKALEEELRSTFNHEEEINLRSVARLPYLQAVIEEILRLYPPATEITPRMSPGDIIDGKWVPEGTTGSIHVYSSNHNPDFFYDPECFQPQRWLPMGHPLYEARFENENHAVCKSFSCGPRDCIGKNLALSEMKMVLARLCWRLDFDVVPGHQDWLDQSNFMMWEKKPLRVNFRAHCILQK